MHQSISSNRREKAFAFLILSSVFITVLLNLIRIITRNEIHSYYQLFRNEYHWSTSLVAFLVIVVFETVSFLDFLHVGLFHFGSLYVCCLTTMYWLNRIWYVLTSKLVVHCGRNFQRTSGEPFPESPNLLNSWHPVAGGRLILII